MDAPGRDEPAAYGSGAFRALTRMKPALVLALLEAELSVLYADADVAFLSKIPGPTSHLMRTVPWRSSRTVATKRTCWGLSWSSTVSAEPETTSEVLRRRGLLGPGVLPPPQMRGASPRSGRRPLPGKRAAATRRASRAPSRSWRTRTTTLMFARCRCRFGRTAWRCRTLYDAPAPEALISFEVPSEVVAFHANYVVGASQKRAAGVAGAVV